MIPCRDLHLLQVDAIGSLKGETGRKIRVLPIHRPACIGLQDRFGTGETLIFHQIGVFREKSHFVGRNDVIFGVSFSSFVDLSKKIFFISLILLGPEKVNGGKTRWSLQFVL